MQAAVAAGHELTTQAAMDIMKRGGNAFDGALAGMMMSCVSEPVLASPGGGGYMMARNGSSGEVVFYDFFVQTPRRKRAQETIEFYAAHADFGSALQEFQIGAGAAAVPGLLPGFFAIASDLGKLGSGKLLAPALQAASQGVEVTDFQAYLFSVIIPILTAHKDVTGLFRQNGTMPQAGERFYNPGLANLFVQMQQQGESLCQSGAYAKAITAQSDQCGGHLTAQDLQGFKVRTSKPLEIDFQGYKIYLPPPPAAGGTLVAFGLLLIDRLLEEKKIKVPGLVSLVEVMTQTNAVRDRSPEGVLKPSVIRECLEQLRKRKVVSKGTTHISVIDEDLNIAALTLTNGEGNGRLVGDFGFMLNNMLGEEDLHPRGFHQWEEGQRLSSMMTPTLIESPDGKWTALGSGGSNRIKTAILQVIVNLVSRQMGLSEAIDLARLHAEKCGTVSFEQGAALEHLSLQDLSELAKAFPDIDGWGGRNMFFGGVHCVSGGKGHDFEAAADSRRSGCSIVL